MGTNVREPSSFLEKDEGFFVVMVGLRPIAREAASDDTEDAYRPDLKIMPNETKTEAVIETYWTM